MSAGCAPHGGSIGEVVARQARNAYSPLSLLNCLNQALHSFANLIISRRLHCDIQPAGDKAERRQHHAMGHGRFGCGAIRAGHRCALRDRALQLVLFVFLDDSAMEAPVQQRLHLRINMRFHRLEKEPVQLSALAFGESMPERFKLPAFLIGDVGFASDVVDHARRLPTIILSQIPKTIAPS